VDGGGPMMGILLMDVDMGMEWNSAMYPQKNNSH
jgi:hypothetical protein